MTPHKTPRVAAAARPAGVAAKFKQAGVCLALLAGVLAPLAAWPATASADGPASPIATSYLARVTHHPAGVQVRIVDGYLEVWLRVPPAETVEVLDYRGAPWVRFDRRGVEVNENSVIYYLSQTPVPATPPASLKATTAPHWHRVTTGHAYGWRDGRLHALATIALAPGATYAGAWSLPVRVDGRLTRISGGVWYAAPPSPVWLWPIAVIIACVLAAWRIRAPGLDRRLGLGLAYVLLAAIALAGAARELHGRPTVSGGQMALLAVTLAAVALAAGRLASGRSGYPLLFLIAFASLWAGLTLASSLFHAYVLLALPAFAVRSSAVVLLGGGVGLVLMALRALEAETVRGRARRETRTASLAA